MPDSSSRRSSAILLLLAASLATATAGCAGGPEIELTGTRADGLMVICDPLPQEGRFACDPQEPAAPGRGGGDGNGVGEGDGGGEDCASWTAGGSAMVLWPPNHKLELVTLEQCAEVRASCSAGRAVAASGRIVAVTSDEPLDALGDGHTEAGDLQIVGARAVLLRSERQGGGDGRVYRIESEDDEGHHDVCEVHVPHDRGPYGGAERSREAVRVLATP